jgi:hypothetical protein
MLAYQRNRRAYGDPIDTRPLSGWWCLAPLAALVVLGNLVSRAEYRPRLQARLTVAAGEGSGVRLLMRQDDLSRSLRAGQELEGERGNREPLALRVTAATPSDCGLGACLEVAAVVLPSGTEEATLSPEAELIDVRLPARSLLSIWRKK